MSTEYQKEIISLVKDGLSLEDIAQKFGVSELTIKKKIILYEREQNRTTTKSKKSSGRTLWDIEKIKAGIKRFEIEFGRHPTATDFDQVAYLPSARQIQRVYGGMTVLRSSLGFGKDINYTKGDLRGEIARKSNIRGLEFEEKIENLLIAKFGETYVHTQKRYNSGTKSRYDFFVYAKGRCFGIDVFAVNGAYNIEKNIRLKIKKYENTPDKLTVYFVVDGEFTKDELSYANRLIIRMGYSEKFYLLGEKDFFVVMDSFERLDAPVGLISMVDLYTETTL